MKSMRDVIERADEVKVIAEKNGTKITSFADAAALQDMEGYEPTPKSGLRTYNPDGSLARTRVKAAAINPEIYFANRFRKVSKKIQVVVDWRAITEQDTGSVYLKNIPCYIISRNDDGKLVVESTKTVSDDDFVKSFTDTLDEEAMKEIAPLIANFGADITTSSMPI